MLCLFDVVGVWSQSQLSLANKQLCMDQQSIMVTIMSSASITDYRNTVWHLWCCYFPEATKGWRQKHTSVFSGALKRTKNLLLHVLGHLFKPFNVVFVDLPFSHTTIFTICRHFALIVFNLSAAECTLQDVELLRWRSLHAERRHKDNFLSRRGKQTEVWSCPLLKWCFKSQAVNHSTAVLSATLQDLQPPEIQEQFHRLGPDNTSGTRWIH